MTEKELEEWETLCNDAIADIGYGDYEEAKSKLEDLSRKIWNKKIEPKT